MNEHHHADLRDAVVRGDLAALDERQRSDHYQEVCRSVGLNPLTRPLEFLELDGKLRLYAKRDATDQLRRLHHVSIEIVDRTVQEDVYIVRARATTPEGRTDEALGAVSLTGLVDDDLANALMKAETKAKRRVTLSICGLGLLDETELETIPALRRAADPAQQAAAVQRPTAATILRAWDAHHATRADLYAHVKAGYGKRVLGLSAAEVVEVLAWIETQAPVPATGEADEA